MTSFMLGDTTASKISSQLTHLRHQMGTPAVGMVLTLVVVCGESDQYDAVRAATEAAREHPSRILVVIPRDAHEPNRLDAEIRFGESTPGEVILLRLYGELTRHADSVVSPLLLTDTPVVAGGPATVPRSRSRIRSASWPSAASSTRGPRRTRSRRSSAGPAVTCPATPTWPGPG